MAQFIVLQVDPVPAVGEMAEGLRAWRISAATEADAATAVGTLLGQPEAVVFHVIPAAALRRFTTSPTLLYGSSEG